MINSIQLRASPFCPAPGLPFISAVNSFSSLQRPSEGIVISSLLAVDL